MKSDAKKRVAGPEHVRNETVCVAVGYDVTAPVPFGDAAKDEVDSFISGESAAVFVVFDAEVFINVVGRSTPVCADASFDSDRLTFRETVSHASVTDSGGIIDTSGIPLYKSLHLTFALHQLFL